MGFVACPSVLGPGCQAIIGKTSIGDLTEAARRSTKSHTIDRSFASWYGQYRGFMLESVGNSGI